MNILKWERDLYLCLWTLWQLRVSLFLWVDGHTEFPPHGNKWSRVSLYLNIACCGRTGERLWSLDFDVASHFHQELGGLSGLV